MTAIKLFLLPYAGASKYSYKSFEAYLDRDLVETIPLELPGRGARWRESLLRDLHQMADDILRQMSPLPRRPYAIYGHSLGTLLGWLVTRKIAAAGANLPLCLFWSGRGGPSVEREGPKRHLLPAGAFFETLKGLGGFPGELYEHAEFRIFFEPVLRADLQAVETFTYCAGEPFDVPIVCLIGDNEPITREEARAWQRETTANVEVLTMPGNHFFIFDNQQALCRLITGRLLQAVAAGV